MAAYKVRSDRNGRRHHRSRGHRRLARTGPRLRPESRRGRDCGPGADFSALADQVRPTDVLFVIVRRPGGTPRPVAAKRIENPKFPVPFEITNADVMVQGSELRGMVDVMARLDRDGQAGPAQPGDIEGRYAKNPTLPGGRDLEIILDTVKN